MSADDRTEAALKSMISDIVASKDSIADRAARELLQAAAERPAWLDEQDFYEVCQAYRHSREIPLGLPTPVQAFEALKDYIAARCAA